jgi:hypothetical protein
MADDEVTRNLKGMDELDFVGWNSADWHGVFAHYHTDDVLVDHVPPGQIRIRRLDVRGRRVRRWWPDGDRREMARRRNRRGIHLDVAPAATLRPGWLSFDELWEAHSRELVAAIA